MKHATTPAYMRSSNRKLVLDLIRLKSYSRAEIAGLTKLSRASITLIVDELIEQGIVRESKKRTHAVSSGRHPIKLKIVEDSRYILGVCVMRCGIQAGMVDLGGKVLCEFALPHSLTPADTIRAIKEAYDSWCTQNRMPAERILGIGLMAPGPLLYDKGYLLNPHQLTPWHHLPVTEMFSSVFGLPAILERDTNALALEEKYFGPSFHCENFMVLQVDVGVGSGVIIHNRLYRGKEGMGSEIGHVSIHYDGPVCPCGNRGCLERYIAMPILLKDTRFHAWHEVVDAAQKKQADALSLLALLSDYLSTAIVTAFNLFDLERVLLLGDIRYHADMLLERVNTAVRKRLFLPERGDMKLVDSSGTVYGIRTGAMPVIHAFYHERR